MRKYAILIEPIPLNDYGQMCRRIILDKQAKGTIYLYLSESVEDEGASFDHFFTSLEDAYECARSYGVEKEDWIDIDEAMQNTIRTYIRPVRYNLELNILEEYDGNTWNILKV